MPLPQRYGVALLVWLGPAGIAAAQANPGVPRLAWRPRVPLEGSLLVLCVRPLPADSVTAIRGALAGEPLHFERVGDAFRAVGAVPLGARDSVAARVVIERAGSASDTLLAALRVGRRRAAREQLEVAGAYVQPPESLAGRIRIERDLLQDVRQRSHDTPRQWHQAFVRPRPSAVTSAFGVSRVFNGVVGSRHLGVDFAGRPGAPVRAANRGVVAFVGDLYYSGTTIFIDHGAGLVTGYFHLSRALVVAGDTVSRGQLIGRVGATGRVTKPHLHWFAAYGSVTVDPLGLVRLGTLMDRPSW